MVPTANPTIPNKLLGQPWLPDAIRLELQRRIYERWCWATRPTWHWEWEHLKLIRGVLAKVTAGEIDRVILTVPPRHGKSEMVTVGYSAYRIERNPAQRVVIGAYNQTLANKFSRKARRLIENRMPDLNAVRSYVDSYTNLLELSRERTAVDDWETSDGGGLRAVGVGGGITGQGGDLIIVDDPVKNRKEANSPTVRQTVWDWWTDDLYTRLEPGAAMIIIMTRWHEDDLVGRILATPDLADQFTVINLPALAEADDPMGRAVGEALCPERYDRDELLRIKAVLQNSWYALYQQRPQPLEGGMFKRQWFIPCDSVPFDAERVRYWDKAGTAGDGAYTVGVLMARDLNGLYYVEDVVRGQWEAVEREEVILRTAIDDTRKYGLLEPGAKGGYRVIMPGPDVWFEQEPGSGGKESAQASIRRLAGFNAYAERVTGAKEVRAEPWASQCGGGNVRILRAEWNRAYVDEHTAFHPDAAYKDQVDASSGAFSKLSDGIGWEDFDNPLDGYRG